MEDRVLKHIDGQTEIHPDDLKLLIPNLSLISERDEFEQANITEGFKWALSSSKMKREILTATGLIELHKRMFDQTWRWAGKLRSKPLNIGVEPHQIQTELAKLLGDVKFWLNNKTFPLDEIAIRFHHRLVFVHPFTNGNGRHSRLAAELLLHYHKHSQLSWGGKDFKGEDRAAYIAALKLADRDGDYDALLKFALGR